MYTQDLRLPLERGSEEAGKIYKERMVWISISGLVGAIVSIVIAYPVSSILFLTFSLILLLSFAYINPFTKQLFVVFSLQLALLVILASIMLASNSNEYIYPPHKNQEAEDEYAVKI